MLKQVPLVCSGHSRPVVYVYFSEIADYSYYLLSASKDGNPMLRNGSTGDWIGTFQGHKGAVWSCALTHNATKALTGSADFSAKIWDASTGDELHSFPHDHIVKSVDLPKDDQSLTFLTSAKNSIYLHDLENYDRAPTPIVAHLKNIRQCSFVPEQSHLFITGAEDNALKLWDVRTKGCVLQITLPSSLYGFEVSRSGTVISVASGRHCLFYDLMTLTEVKRVDAACLVYSVSLSPDETQFVFGGEDFKVYNFDYETLKEIESYKGHFGPVHCVSYSPDGELYASGSEDGTIRLWQTHLGKNYGLWRVASCSPDDD